MRDDIYRFLSVHGRLPARLLPEQVGWLLNCQPHDIPMLVAVRLLKPLGNPPASGVKYYATEEVLELSKDKAWLGRMTNATYNHWRAKNAGRISARAKIGDNMKSEIVD
jgi:hypothetical protein